MQRKYWLILAFVALFLTAGIFLPGSSPAAVNENPTCCKKNTPATPECVDKGGNSSEMVNETLSRQFIFITSPVY